MSKFVAERDFKTLWITSFWTQILHLNFKENAEKLTRERLQHIWA